MATMVDRMLVHAEELIDAHPTSGAAKRRAISSAYYAAFHKIMQVCADALLPDESFDSALYERVYRSIDHGPLRKAFERAPLKTEPRFRRIGELIAPLQSARMKADYSPPDPTLFTQSEAREHIEQAREIIEMLENFDLSDYRTLAIHLLFKDRPKD